MIKTEPRERPSPLVVERGSQAVTKGRLHASLVKGSDKLSLNASYVPIDE